MDDDFQGTPNPLNPLARNPLAEEPEVDNAVEEKPEAEQPVEPAQKQEPAPEEPKPEEKTEPEPEAKSDPEPVKPAASARPVKKAPVEPEAPAEPEKPEAPAKPSMPTKMRRIDDFAPRNTNTAPELVDDFAPLTMDDFKPVQMAPSTPPMQPATPQPVAPQPVRRPARPMRPAPQPMPQAQPVQPAPQVQSGLDPDLIQQIGVVTNLDGTRPVDSLDPTNRPMKKAAEVIEKPKKKKTGMIVGIIVSLLVAVACITAAVLIVIRVNRADPMTAAVEKIMQEGLPEKVAIDGKINIDVYNKTIGASKITIDLNSQIMPNSLMNTTNATMNLILRDGGEVSMTLDEIYAANGDLYIKVDNLAEVMDVFIPDTVTIDGADLAEEEPEMIEPMDVLEQTTNAIEVMDDQWIRISTDELDSIVSAMTDEGDTSICTARLIVDMLKTRNTVAGAYLSNQFIASTDKDVPIENVNYPVQRLAVDGEKFANFIDGSSSSLSAVGNYLECLGYDKTALNADSILEELAKGPAVYAEIDGDNNFTRFYFIGNMGEEDNLDGQITADFNITYPDNINISEPTEYTDSSEILQNVMQMIEEMQTEEEPEEAPAEEAPVEEVP